MAHQEKLLFRSGNRQTVGSGTNSLSHRSRAGIAALLFLVFPAFEESLVEHAQSEERPPWFPLPGRGSIEITGTRVLQAVRLTTGSDQPSVGAVAGRFDTVFQWVPGQQSGAVEISWAAVLTVTELGVPRTLLWSAFGSLTDGETRGVFDLERVTNLDDDLEYELVIGTDKYGGTGQLVFDVSDPENPAIQELALHGCD